MTKSKVFLHSFIIFLMLISPKVTSQNIYLDENFGTKGIMSIPDLDLLTSRPYLYPNNDFLISGVYTIVNNYQSRIHKFDKSGSAISEFGINGVIDSLPGLTNPSIFSIVGQNDAKIILIGEEYINGYYSWFTVRLNKDGSFDESYGVKGFMKNNTSGVNVLGAIITDENKLFIVGAQDVGSVYQGVIFKIDENGQLDNNFGQEGSVSISTFSNTILSSISITNDNKILVAGGAKAEFFAAQFDIDGTPDLSYGNNGSTTIKMQPGKLSNSFDSVLDENGRLVLTGYTDDDNNTPAIARINSNGTIDSTFNKDGKLVQNIGLDWAYTRSIGILPNKNYVISTCAIFDNLPDWNYALFSIDQSGKIDSTFGIDGIVECKLPYLFDDPTGMAINDNTLILSGIGIDWNGNNQHNNIVKYSFNPTNSTPNFKFQKFQIAPNPFKESFSLKGLYDVTDNIKVEVNDINGTRLIEYLFKQSDLNSDYINIECNDLNPGVYIVNIFSTRIREIHKIIKL